MKKYLFLLILSFMLVLTSCNVTHDGKLLVTDDHYHWYKTDSGEVVEKAEHNFNIFVRVAKEPTCVEEGVNVYRCECGKDKELSIPALGHTFGEDLLHNEENHYYECYCGEKTLFTAHDCSIPGEVINESTCTTQGSQYYSCVCGYTIEKALPLLDHEYGEELISDENTHWGECHCGHKNNVVEHKYEIAKEITLAPKCTETGKQIFECECGLSKELEIPSLGGHVDNDFDITCDNEGCNVRVLPEDGALISLHLANQIGLIISTSRKYYVEGVVATVDDAKNGIFHIKDEVGDEFLVRMPVNSEGVSHYNWECKIVEGDIIKIYGKISKFTSQSKSYATMQGATLVSIEHDHEYSEATCLEAATCRCGHILGDVLPHEDANANGFCDNCNKNLNEKSSVMIVNTLAGDPNSGVLVGTEKRTWENDIFTLVVSKGTSSSIYTTADAYMKFKKGNVFTITSKNSVKITKIIVTSTTTSYGKTFDTSANKVSGLTSTYVENVITIIVEEGLSEIVIPLTGSSRISKIEVIY